MVYSVLGGADFFSFMFISSLESMYLIYRKHKLCRSLVVRWWFGGFGFWCSLRCDRWSCLVTLSRRLLLTGCRYTDASFVTIGVLTETSAEDASLGLQPLAR